MTAETGEEEPNPYFTPAALLDAAERETRRIINDDPGDWGPDWHANVLLCIILPDLRKALRKAGLDIPEIGPHSHEPGTCDDDQQLQVEPLPPVPSPPPTSPPRAAKNRETHLYRWYDDTERLLYIGISDNLGSRTKGHVKGSSWMDFAASSTVERYPSRQEAINAEEAAIKVERPLFNHQHNQTPEAHRRLVDYLVEHGRTDLLAPAITRG